jgi:glycosyltransferase involved in cell wall biosynthesis
MTFAEALQDDYEVVFIAPFPEDFAKLQTSIGINLDSVELRAWQRTHDRIYPMLNRYVKQSPDYDLFLSLSNTIYPQMPGLGRRNLLYVQFPYGWREAYGRRNYPKILPYRLFRATYDRVLVHSAFVKSHLDDRIRQPVEVLYPPVDLAPLQAMSFAQKKNQVISTGRFIGTKDSKCQLEMVQCFKKICDAYPELNLTYLCIGGERPEGMHQDYLKKVREAAVGYPIQILTNVSLAELAQHYAESKVFWHAKGFRSDPKHPEFTEHFGIVTVEAMASGCIPIAINAGGQPEIVQDGVNGFLWNTEEELIQKTVAVFQQPDAFVPLSECAIASSTQFSADRYKENVRSLVDRLLV